VFVSVAACLLLRSMRGSLERTFWRVP